MGISYQMVSDNHAFLEGNAVKSLSMGVGRRKDSGATPSVAPSQVIFKPRSVREVRKYLKPPLSDVTAVLYFTEQEAKPFMLDRRGGLSAEGRYRLSKKWRLTKDKLDRIFIITHLNGGSIESEGPSNIS